MVMQKLTIQYAVVALLALLLAACGGGHEDLDKFMGEVKAKPATPIKPIPPFKAYKAFTYSATGLRSPFERPVEVREIAALQASTNVRPDTNRPTEFLERYGIDSLSMVGSLQMGGTLWALLQDQTGNVHRVRQGNFIGRNHGRIIEVAETHLAVIEIVATGSDSWVERPRTLKLKNID